MPTTIISSLTNTLLSLFHSQSLTTRCLCLLLLTVSLFSRLAPQQYAVHVQVALSNRPHLLLPPHFHLWTLLTSAFIESSAILLALDLVVLSFLGKLVAPLWSERQVLLFFLFSQLSLAVFASLFYVVLALAVNDEMLLFRARLDGMAGGFLAAILVAIKQMMPEPVLLRVSSLAIKIRNRNMPLLAFVSVGAGAAVGVFRAEYVVMFAFGTLSAFFYLRFYQWHGGQRGDWSDAFSFASLCPRRVQPAFEVMSDGAFRLAVCVGVCPGGAVGSGGGGAAESRAEWSRIENERRRTIAQRALQSRLSESEMPLVDIDVESTAAAAAAESSSSESMPNTLSVDYSHAAISPGAVQLV